MPRRLRPFNKRCPGNESSCCSAGMSSERSIGIKFILSPVSQNTRTAGYVVAWVDGDFSILRQPNVHPRPESHNSNPFATSHCVSDLLPEYHEIGRASCRERV